MNPSEMSPDEISPEEISPEESPESGASHPVPPNPVEELQTLVADLYWMSESDYPFEVSLFPAQEEPMTPERLLTLTGHEPESALEELAVSDFFEPATQPQDWYEDAELHTMNRFQALVQWLEQYLQDLHVYRVGEIEMDVYVMGRLASGEWLNLSTKIVET